MEAMRRESEEQHQLVHDRMERRLLVELNNVSVRVRIQAGLRMLSVKLTPRRRSRMSWMRNRRSFWS